MYVIFSHSTLHFVAYDENSTYKTRQKHKKYSVISFYKALERRAQLSQHLAGVCTPTFWLIQTHSA